MIRNLSISVVVPIYNAGQYLQETLDSICGQTLGEMEIICVDDGSTDNSQEILRVMAEKDPRIKIIHQANAGPGAARNTGLRAASGEYLAFLDADDLYEPDMLSTLYSQAKQHHADVVMCLYDYFFTKTGKRYQGTEPCQQWQGRAFHPAGEAASSIFQICIGWPWDKLFRTEYIRANEWDYPMLRNSEDGVFVFPAVAHAQTMIIYPKTLVHHREHAGSVSKTLNRWPTECVKAIQLIYERLGKLKHIPAIAHSFSSWARLFSTWNLRELECEARPALRKAVRNILEPQFRLLQTTHANRPEDKDYRILVSPDVCLEIQVAPDNLDTLRECIRSIEEQANCTAEIVFHPQNCTIPQDLLYRTRYYLTMPEQVNCPVFRLPASRGVKWNKLAKAIRSVLPGEELTSAHTFDICMRSRFYSHTATTRTWRLWGHGVLTLQKKQDGLTIFLLGHQLFHKG